ncbi:MAG TPA: hypothetical protein VES97_04820 [Solirubrobacteraceae bacterium]|nr:hypothetical protein [Solirubrobacteraceae bacterium]
MAALAATAGTAAGAQVIYNNIPLPFPGGMSSMAFQATQTSEFGGQVQFAGALRARPTVTVVMSSWACQSGNWFENDCVTSPGATFTEPVTLNVYEVGAGGAPGALLASDTQTFQMPYRPSANHVKCPQTGPEESGRFFLKGECLHERVFKILFPNVPLNLPEKAIITVAYNTSQYGPAPYGALACESEPQGCPYDSLNVAVRNPGFEATPVPTVGSDPLPEDAYISSITAGNYCENPGGVGKLAISKNCWTQEQPAIAVKATKH